MLHGQRREGMKKNYVYLKGNFLRKSIDPVFNNMEQKNNYAQLYQLYKRRCGSIH